MKQIFIESTRFSFNPIHWNFFVPGMFVQWVMCGAIFCVGLIVGGYECFQSFYPLAMLGGAFWATGNIS